MNCDEYCLRECRYLEDNKSMLRWRESNFKTSSFVVLIRPKVCAKFTGKNFRDETIAPRKHSQGRLDPISTHGARHVYDAILVQTTYQMSRVVVSCLVVA